MQKQNKTKYNKIKQQTIYKLENETTPTQNKTK